jgi:hypothetical protein
VGVAGFVVLAGLAAAAFVARWLDGGVEVEPPSPSTRVAPVCRDLAKALPDRLDGLEQRATVPDSTFTAAWGDPAVVVRCGVRPPTGLQPTSQLFGVNRVDWFPQVAEDGSATFTTTGRVTYVEVVVPESRQPGSNYLVDLAAPVREAVPEDEG